MKVKAHCNCNPGSHLLRWYCTVAVPTVTAQKIITTSELDNGRCPGCVVGWSSAAPFLILPQCRQPSPWPLPAHTILHVRPHSSHARSERKISWGSAPCLGAPLTLLQHSPRPSSTTKVPAIYHKRSHRHTNSVTVPANIVRAMPPLTRDVAHPRALSHVSLCSSEIHVSLASLTATLRRIVNLNPHAHFHRPSLFDHGAVH